jgi:hypothetical protein
MVGRSHQLSGLKIVLWLLLSYLPMPFNTSSLQSKIAVEYGVYEGPRQQVQNKT